MARYLYSELASALNAFKRCKASGNPYADKWEDTIDMLVDLLPSGSGIDCGTKLDMDASHSGKLVFHAGFHHMDENGFYCGWTEHTVIVTPSFDGINLRISGRNRNDIKDYLHEVYHHALTQDCEYHVKAQWMPVSVRYQTEWVDSCTMQFTVTDPRDGYTFRYKSPENAQGKALELMRELNAR